MSDEANIQIQIKLAWLALIVAAPPIIIWLAAYMFDKIIPVEWIDFRFMSRTVLYDFSNPDISPDISNINQIPHVPSTVVLSLYVFGFLACVTSVLSLATAIYGAFIFHANYRRSAMTAAACAIVLASAIAVAATYYSNVRLPVGIAVNLIKGTLSTLPAVCSCPDNIGNTGNSLLKIAVIVMSIVALAGFSFWIAALALVGSSQAAPGRRKSLTDLTTLAAATFLLSVVTVHLLFQPGADLIVAAYLPDGQNDTLPRVGKQALADFTNLRNAMTWYWGTAFSLAMASIYFPAELSIPDSQIEKQGLQSIWKLMASVVTVVSPLLASGALQIIQPLVDSISASR